MDLDKITRQGWQKLYKQLSQGNDRTINVKINTADIGIEEVTNFRYCFPLANYLFRKGKINENMPLILNIYFGDRNREQNTGAMARIKSFLSQIQSTSIVKIMLENEKLANQPWDAGRIFPLCQVGDGYHNNDINYKVLTRCVYDSIHQENSLSEEMGPYPQLANALLNRVRNIDQYKGTLERKFKTEEKVLLQNKVNNYLKKYLGDMCVLAQIIWLYILRDLQETKQLYDLPKDEKEMPYVHENILTKSRMDAVVYSEGMQQLIENSCIHSYGHTAWFGFRMHKAGRDVSMHDLSNEVRTRGKLYETYKLCFSNMGVQGQYSRAKNIFNENHRFFFELFVLDDAADQFGMVERYNQMAFNSNCDMVWPVYLKNLSKDEKKTSQKPKFLSDTFSYRDKWRACEILIAEQRELHPYIQNLEDLFDLPVRENNLRDHIEDLIIHYGLRLLRRIVSVNRGYLLGSSPYKYNKTHYYIDGNLSIEQERLKDETSYVTEWSVILPITYQWPDSHSSNVVVNGQNCFGCQIERCREWLYFVNRDRIFHDIKKDEKERDIIKLRENVESVLSALNSEDLRNSVLLLQVENCSTYELEIFSKALFSVISKINRENKNNISASLRIA